MRIDYLADQLKLIGPLAAGLLQHYRMTVPEDTLQTRTAKLTAHLNRNSLLIAWVAHASGEAFTLPQHRGQGVGAALCAVVEKKAAALGISLIYLVTLDQ